MVEYYNLLKLRSANYWEKSERGRACIPHPQKAGAENTIMVECTPDCGHCQSMYYLVCSSKLFDVLASKLNITDNIVQRIWMFLEMNSVHI
jgi:hypothetical protein